MSHKKFVYHFENELQWEERCNREEKIVKGRVILSSLKAQSNIIHLKKKLLNLSHFYD